MQEDIVYCGQDKRKRFIVIGYYTYYPDGGLHDIQLESDFLVGALNQINDLKKRYENVELYDLQNGLAEINIEATNEKIKTVIE